MRVDGGKSLKCKTILVLFIMFLTPIFAIAKDNKVWNSIDSLNIESAYSQFTATDINSIVGIWESHNGVLFMIKECNSCDSIADYQMVMLKDRVTLSTLLTKIPCGKVIALLNKTADKNIFSCEVKDRGIIPSFDIFHLSLRGSKLVYTGSSSIKRKLFAVKLYPTSDQKPQKTKPSSPIREKIERENSK
ncbi:MAG: hypothetical protein IJA09_04565 [Bacteroidales bacterium]|nr:hypothetical protein [Bacteroidales bacterium]